MFLNDYNTHVHEYHKKYNHDYFGAVYKYHSLYQNDMVLPLYNCTAPVPS